MASKSGASKPRARKPSALASLDIVAEGLAQQDGLSERLARARHLGRALPMPPASPQPAQPAPPERNAWRRGKALLQVALPEETHLELSILARRRRLTLSRLVKAALNEWLERHGHTLRVPE